VTAPKQDSLEPGSPSGQAHPALPSGIFQLALRSGMLPSAGTSALQAGILMGTSQPGTIAWLGGDPWRWPDEVLKVRGTGPLAKQVVKWAKTASAAELRRRRFGVGSAANVRTRREEFEARRWEEEEEAEEAEEEGMVEDEEEGQTEQQIARLDTGGLGMSEQDISDGGEEQSEAVEPAWKRRRHVRGPLITPQARTRASTFP
jgi:hypothetical protein